MANGPAVLHVLNTLMPSGAERMIEVAGPLALADGVRPAVLSTGEDGPGPFTPRLAAAGYAVHHLPFTRDPSFILRLIGFFRRHRFDVVHVHCERAAFWIELAAYLGRAPRIVRTVHSVFTFTGTLRMRRMAQRAIARHFLGVVTTGPSPSVADNEGRRFRNPAQHIPAWIDPLFRPPDPEERARARKRFGLSGTAFAVAVVGNCLAVKNHDALIQAVAALAAKGVDVLLLHAGRGETECSERAIAEAEGVADRVRFLGPVEDVRSLLHAADVFAMPSHWEGLGVAAVEGLACGLPALLADVPGLRDLRHFGTAIRWCGTDPNTIAEGLAELAALSDAGRGARAAAAPLVAQERHGAAMGWKASRRLYATPAWSGSQR